MNLDRLFFPKSIAVIGASDNLGGGKLPYFQILQNNRFQGALYPVNPKYQTIGGVPAFPSIDALPEGVDLAIVAAPVQQSLEIIRAAVRKRIKFVHFFTSGFGETGNRQLERDLVSEAGKGGVRIVGPNGVGIYCTESRISFGNLIRDNTPGMVAFLGQSGGITGNFMTTAATRKISLNKVVSYGNQIDLRVEDFLEYFAEDRDIRLIACYIEDIKDSRRFLKALGRTTARKPVIILKGGRTETGAKAAESHTGALSGNDVLWTT
ncbi:MAG: CoA-binding protein, partial [Thermodesulfobacteriota bacterium]